MAFGGFPEVVLESAKDDKKDLLQDIINSYIELDVKLLADYNVSEDLYKLSKLLAARSGNYIFQILVFLIRLPVSSFPPGSYLKTWLRRNWSPQAILIITRRKRDRKLILY